MNNRSTVEHLLQDTGIHINGDKLSDIWVHDDRFYNSVLKDGSLGLGESYMDDWWSCEALDDFLYKSLNSELTKSAKRNVYLIWLSLISSVMNRQTRATAGKVADILYNIGNELFGHMLGKHLNMVIAFTASGIITCPSVRHLLEPNKITYGSLCLPNRSTHFSINLFVKN